MKKQKKFFQHPDWYVRRSAQIGVNMKNLSFTQEFFLCALKPEGNMPSLKSVEISTCIVASGILELLFDEYILIDSKKKIQVRKERTPDNKYLEPLYNNIKNSKSKTVEGIAELYILGSNKKYKELFQALTVSLEEEGYISVQNNNRLLHNKTIVVPNKEETLKIIENLRAEFLENGNITDETIALGALLNKSGLIKNYFTKFEADRLNERLQELKNSDTGIFVKKIMDYIDTLIIIIAAM